MTWECLIQMLSHNKCRERCNWGRESIAGFEISGNELKDGVPGEKNYSLSLAQVHSFRKFINSIKKFSDQKTDSWWAYIKLRKF